MQKSRQLLCHGNWDFADGNLAAKPELAGDLLRASARSTLPVCGVQDGGIGSQFGPVPIIKIKTIG